MGSNSITSDNSNIFLIDDESISLYFDFLANKSDSEDEKDSEEIKEVSLKERNSNKKPKSNIGGNEIIKIPVTFEWENGGNNVYVTGNFCGWKQFFLMKKEENGK